MGRGYLTGTIDERTALAPDTDLRWHFDRFLPQNAAANRPVIESLRRFAEVKNATTAQISLAWLLAQKPWIVDLVEGSSQTLSKLCGIAILAQKCKKKTRR